VAGRGAGPRRPATRGLAASLVLLGVAACHKAPSACFITGVSVADAPDQPGLEARGLDRDDLRRAASEALGRTAGFRLPPAEPSGKMPRCQVTVSLLDARPLVQGGGASQVEALVGLSVTVGEEGEGAREVARYAETVRAGEGSRETLQRAIEGAASRAAAALALGFAESAKPDSAVVRDLDSADTRLRDLAVRVLADRKNSAAVPALLQRLSDPDTEVVERAVGALAQIRDPRAVGPLIALTQRREGPFVTQLVLIIGDIGGPEAIAYLDTLASGHPDPSVRKAAREALSNLRRRSGAGGSAGRR